MKIGKAKNHVGGQPNVVSKKHTNDNTNTTLREHGAHLQFAIGRNDKAKATQPRTESWADFIGTLRQYAADLPAVTGSENKTEYRAFKNELPFISARFNGPRGKANVESRSLLWLDVDAVDEVSMRVVKRAVKRSHAACIYHTTSGHRHAVKGTETHSGRFLFPTSRPMEGADEIEHCQFVLAAFLGIPATVKLDPSVNDAARIMYVPAGGAEFEEYQGDFINVDELRQMAGAAPKKPAKPTTAPKGDLVRFASALSAVPNDDLDYDPWRNIMFAIHHESGGSDEGLKLAHEFSAKSGKYDPDFLDGVVWPYVKDRPDGITGATIYALAIEHGWRDLVVADADLADDAAEQPHDAFYAYLPAHQYLHRPTRAFWPAASVDGHLHYKIDGKKVSTWLDAHRAVQQATWHPAHGELLKDVVVADGGFVNQPGALVYNRYRAPVIEASEASPEPWLKHLRAIYPGEADHLIKWFAHRIQRPGDKINHALVLGGAQGIGKDTILEPVRHGVGQWNWADIDPKMLTGAFNPFVESVVLRINEARDLGDLDRFAFYDHSKTYIAAPPAVLTCNNKHAKAYPVFNVMGVILTTNHKTAGIYLPMDDRRHYVAWSEARKEEFTDEYWCELWKWIENGGAEAVVSYLRRVDLSDFKPKAPPPKTEAFFAIVQANANPDDVALSGLVNGADGTKPPVVTLAMLAERAENAGDTDLYIALTDSKQRRRVPHMMERAGYVAVRNPNADSGLWRINGKRQVVYGDAGLSLAELVKLAQAID